MRPRASTVALLFFFAATFLFFSLFAPRFASAGNMENLMSGFSFLAIVAIGQSFPILVRGIDLSVGAIVALSGMVTFDLSLIIGLPGYVVIPLALLTATLAGAVNGALVVFLRLPPFIATLATLAAYRGLVYSISGRQLVPSLSTTPIRDPWITGLETYFDIGTLTGLSSIIRMPWFPLSFVIMLGLFVMFQVLLVATRFGRDVYAVGGNRDAARLAAVNVGGVTIAAFAISGFCAGVAALLLVARLTTSTEQLGMGMELTAIAAAVIGGVSLQGGTGTVSGPVLGAFLLGVVLLGLTLLGISQFVQQILTGVILLAAVVADRLMYLRRRARFAATLASVDA
jgi:ribose/xylose/arabinose/galactoside ABC-type transport system permease subunit